MENRTITAVAHTKDEALFSIRHVEDIPGIAHSIFEPLAKGGVFVDMIIQGTSYVHSDNTKRTNITFSINREDYKATHKIIKKIVDDLKTKTKDTHLMTKEAISKVSVIGIGMISQSGVAAKMFGLLSSKGINVLAISTSEIKVSVLIEEDYVELAVRTLHSGFNLESL